MTLSSRTFLTLFAFAFALIACRKEGDRVNWNVDALVPLVYTELNINDIIPDSLTEVNEAGLVSLAYADTIFRFELDTLVVLPDTTITEPFSIPFGGIEVAPGTQISNIEEEIEIESNDIELKRAVLETGTIIINLESTFEGAIFCTYQIPDATLNGVPLMVEALVPGATGNNPGSLSLSVDVSGYEIDFSNGSEPFNHAPTSLTVLADPEGSPLPLSLGDGFVLTTTFSSLKPSYAEGYFGQQTVESAVESTDINAFDIVQSGTLDLDAVSVELQLINGFGVDIRANILQLNAINTDNGGVVPLNHAVIGAPVNLNRADNPDGYPEYSSYSIALNESNSAIDEMLELLPDQAQIEASLELNPLGNVSNHNDFAYSSSTIEGILDVDIPLCLIADELTLADTTDFELGESDELDPVNSGRLILQITNGFPLEGAITIHALRQGELEFTVMDNRFFGAALTDDDNTAIAPNYSEVLASLSREQIDLLQVCDQVVLEAAFSTSNLSEHVKIYDHYSIGVKLVADLDYHVNQ